MINIAISNDVYNWADRYAQEHHTNIRDLVENYLNKLRHSSAQVDEAEMKLQQLLGLTKGMKLNNDDMNGNKAKQDYLENKYANEICCSMNRP